MKQSVLEEIGLTKSEINVYLALLDLGSSSTGKIVDKSGASSSKIYEILDRLMQKGLVSFIIKSGIKYFEAAPPERIMDYMKDKEEDLNKQKQDLKDLIPELELKRKISKYKSEATIFKGLKGAQTAMADVLKTMKKGERYYLFGGTSASWPPYARFIKHYHEQRSKKGVIARILYSSAGSPWANDIKHLPNTEIKFAPSQIFTSSFVLMYKEKTLIAVPSKDDVTYFRIDNKEVTDSFKSQFELLWNQDAMVLKGEDAVQQVFEEMLEFGSCDFIAARGYFVDKRSKYVDEWEKRAIKKGFKMRNIVDPGTKGHRITKFPFVETKYTLPKEFSELSVFWIYGNKVVISNWTEKEPIVVVMNNKSLHDMYKKQFESLWRKDKF
jgi:sugar-specific transcriptional regulator TrmB